MAKPGQTSESKAATIRSLAALGVARKEIAERLGVSENHVNSSLSRDRAAGRHPREPRAERDDAGEIQFLRLADDGSLLLPAELIRTLGLRSDSPIVVALVAGEIRVVSAAEVARRITLRA